MVCVPGYARIGGGDALSEIPNIIYSGREHAPPPLGFGAICTIGSCYGADAHVRKLYEQVILRVCEPEVFHARADLTTNRRLDHPPERPIP